MVRELVVDGLERPIFDAIISHLCVRQTRPSPMDMVKMTMEKGTMECFGNPDVTEM